MRARRATPLRARKADCFSRRQECHVGGMNASRKRGGSPPRRGIPSQIRHCGTRSRMDFGALQQQLSRRQSQMRVPPPRCHLGHGGQHELPVLHGRMREHQPCGRRSAGLASDNAAADTDDVDVEWTGTPARADPASGGAFEALQATQNESWRKRRLDPDDAVVEARLTHRPDRPGDDDGGRLGDRKPETADLLDSPFEGLRGGSPGARLVGPKGQNGGMDLPAQGKVFLSHRCRLCRLNPKLPFGTKPFSAVGGDLCKGSGHFCCALAQASRSGLST